MKQKKRGGRGGSRDRHSNLKLAASFATPLPSSHVILLRSRATRGKNTQVKYHELRGLQSCRVLGFGVY